MDRVNGLYEITETCLREVSETKFATNNIKERGDLQRLLRSKIEVISPDTLVVSEEFGEWNGSSRRIDLLGLDKDANIGRDRTETHRRWRAYGPASHPLCSDGIHDDF